jgi:hypothetical protein
MSQEDYEPGDPRALPEVERERLIQRKMAELRNRMREDEIEQEAMRRLVEEEEQERLDAMRHLAEEEEQERLEIMRLQAEEQEIREFEEYLEEDERQEREAKERLLEQQRVTPETDPAIIFYQWTINGKNFYRNAKGHVFKFKEGLMNEDDWLGIWFPETGFVEAPFPIDEYEAV